jgi:hypothetical protein
VNSLAARNPLARCILVSEHAVDRFIERVALRGARSRNEIVLRILDLLRDATPIDDTRFYAAGVTITVIDSVVTTVYRPQGRSQKSKIHKALRRPQRPYSDSSKLS